MIDSGFPDIKGGFAFIGTLLDVRVPLPHHIGEHVKLERASDAQVSEIKRLIPAGGGLGLTYHYEHEWVPVATSTGEGRQTRPLPRSDWRYYVFTWEGSNAAVMEVQRALNLVPPAASSVLQVLTREPYGNGEFRGQMVESVAAHFQHREPPPSPIVVDDERIQSWILTCVRLNALDHERYRSISRAIDLLDQLRRYPSFGHLQVLSYFMVLEMLLTHKPSDKEVGDSLSHQIRTKVALLSRRLPGGLDHNVFGTDISVDKIWAKLYAYRSVIAHGGVPDFERELKLLKDARTAWTFLATATARLARYSLEDPDLIDSLKKV